MRQKRELCRAAKVPARECGKPAKSRDRQAGGRISLEPGLGAADGGLGACIDPGAFQRKARDFSRCAFGALRLEYAADFAAERARRPRIIQLQPRRAIAQRGCDLPDQIAFAGAQDTAALQGQLLHRQPRTGQPGHGDIGAPVIGRGPVIADRQIGPIQKRARP